MPEQVLDFLGEYQYLPPMPNTIPEGHKSIVVHVPAKTHQQVKNWAESRGKSVQACLCEAIVMIGAKADQMAKNGKKAKSK